MTEIGQKLIGIVRAKAAENPEFVYVRPRHEDFRPGSCTYVRGAQPSCLIGHALWDADLIDSSFEQCGLNTVPITVLVHDMHLELDNLELYWLSGVQSYQDDGRPWGAAVEWADNA